MIRNKLILAFLLLLILNNLHSQQISEITRFPTELIYSGLSYAEDGRSPDPKILKIFKNGFLLWSHKLLVLDEKGKLEYEIYLEKQNRSSFTFDPYLYYEQAETSPLIISESYIFNFDGRLVAEIPSFFEKDIWNGFNPINGRIFYQYSKTGIDSVEINNSLPKKQLSLIGEEKTRELFTLDSKWGHFGLQLDNKDRLFLNGEIVTRDWGVFITWLIEKYGTIKQGPKADGLGISNGMFQKGVKWNPRDLIEHYSAEYKGRDAAGNWYWDNLVFSSEGILLTVIASTGLNTFSWMPAPSGDYYFLAQKENWLILYRLENTWSPEAKIAYQEGLKKSLYKLPDTPATAYRAPNGMVLEDGVRVRWNPNTDNPKGINTNLKKGTIVQVLARTEVKETINGQTSYWYAVKTSEEIYGWSFGAYIDVTEPDKIIVGHGNFRPYISQ